MNMVSEAQATSRQAPHDHAWRRLDAERPGDPATYTCDLCPAIWPVVGRVTSAERG
jgi:hypothetical protein